MVGIKSPATFTRALTLALFGFLALSILAAPGASQAQPRAPFRLQEATIDEIHTAMRSGGLTCRQLVQLYLNRIEAYDQQGPALNAIQTVNPEALGDADRLDSAFRASGPTGPLHCIPVVVKDQVQVTGMPTTYGSALFRDFVPEWEATIVTRLRAAGAVILAKSTMGEYAAGFAGTAYGVGRNAYDPTRNPSGSSGGSGVAVAANFATLAVAEDTLGSIRGPAARSSTVGLRPTTPLVSRYGMMPATPSRDTLGPIARTVRDTARMLDVIAGYDSNDPLTAAAVGQIPTSYTSSLVADGLRGVRLGVIREPMGTGVNPEASDFIEVRSVLDRALADMRARGAEVVDPVVIPSLLDLLARTTGTYEAEEAINAYLAGHAGAPVKTLHQIVLSEDVLPARRTGLMGGIGHTISDPGFLAQIHVRDELRQAVYTVMADYQLDALVYASFDLEPEVIPADVMTSFTAASQRGSNRNLSPMIGFPALTVPAGYSTGDLPVAVEFMGRPWSEALLFKMGYGYEQATKHRHPPSTAPALPGEP